LLQVTECFGAPPDTAITQTGQAVPNHSLGLPSAIRDCYVVTNERSRIVGYDS